MKIFLFIYLLLLSSCPVWSQDTIIYPEKKCYCYGNYRNGKKTGIWICKDIANNLIETGKYRNDMKNGHFIYYLNKIKTSQGTYASGNKTGLWKEYYIDGREVVFGYYKNNVKVGVWYTYRNDCFSFYSSTIRKIKRKGKLINKYEYRS